MDMFERVTSHPPESQPFSYTPADLWHMLLSSGISKLYLRPINLHQASLLLPSLTVSNHTQLINDSSDVFHMYLRPHKKEISHHIPVNSCSTLTATIQLAFQAKPALFLSCSCLLPVLQQEWHLHPTCSASQVLILDSHHQKSYIGVCQNPHPVSNALAIATQF